MAVLTASIVVLWTLVGCTSHECYDNKNSLPLAGFYSSTESPREVYIDSVAIRGVGAPDSLYLAAGYYFQQVYMPLELEKGETSYVFEYLTESLAGITDTVTFRYNEVPYFVSEECGAIYKYEIKEITTTGNVIDSVTCPRGVIDNISEVNIRIYLNDNVVGGFE